MSKYNLDHETQEFLFERGTDGMPTTNKCEICGKRYKLPNSVFEPRDKICFTCENNLCIGQCFSKALSSFRNS